jgi:uncharacterized protein (DUF488 family)
MQPASHTIWTIGHSTRSIGEFIAMLKSFQIELLVDVRHFPGSCKYPHFNKEALHQSLAEEHIRYEHIESLGGRRKARFDSPNIAWKNLNLRGYADYMETPAFKTGITQLERLATERRTAYMCSEAVWWRCHRSLISDLLKVIGWRVQHIMDTGKSQEHSFTSPARVVDGELTYTSLL